MKHEFKFIIEQEKSDKAAFAEIESYNNQIAGLDTQIAETNARIEKCTDTNELVSLTSKLSSFSSTKAILEDRKSKVTSKFTISDNDIHAEINAFALSQKDKVVENIDKINSLLNEIEEIKKNTAEILKFSAKEVKKGRKYLADKRTLSASFNEQMLIVNTCEKGNKIANGICDLNNIRESDI